MNWSINMSIYLQYTPSTRPRSWNQELTSPGGRGAAAYMADAHWPMWSGSPYFDGNTDYYSSSTTNGWFGDYAFRHRKKANFLFMDGHIAALSHFRFTGSSNYVALYKDSPPQ
jgi:prepilin-type processing-associated H-X9-DG protein